ncbi:AAA family ATPase [Sphaerothrix gracilis]|uniref:NACHT and WD repeat domain-containing protein n=1 Tax=Sphaerothrix gracilis TaxID=3151835 RepID=UPI0031FCAA60
MNASDSHQPSSNPAQTAFENVKAGRDIKAYIRQESNIRIEENAVGSAIVSGDHNTIYVIHQTTEHQHEARRPDDTAVSIGPNPYKGLAAFNENDADRYFGREGQVQRLWQRFQDLVEQSGRADAVPRFLPILGPSGCGKSSLARAGFIPELSRRPLPGKEQMRVAVLVPGTHPVEALAGVLAKVATQDPMPVTKTREFTTELKLPTAAGLYDGMRRIADLMPQIKDSPLVVLVDQFEEVYSLCKDPNERQAFIENLLCAASDPTGNLSVMITLRSDFLGETQRHPMLNQVIGSDQSVIVPAMTEAELRRAIAEPAKQVGHPLDEATVDLMVKDTEGREGALPLLQFALTRIWGELGEGTPPTETYRKMGGVGGALAGQAQEIYDKLPETEKDIARRIFIGLVQLGEGTRDTRRRAAVENLMANQDKPETWRQVLDRFSSPRARLITLSSQAHQEIAEVTHEALFGHWQQLNDWLDSSRDDIRFERRLEAAAQYWQDQKRPAGLLWQRPDLDLLRDYHKRLRHQMTARQLEFLQAAVGRETQQKMLLGGVVSALAVLAAGMTWFGIQAHQSEQRALVRQLAAQSEHLMNQTSATRNEAGALLAVKSFASLKTWQEESRDVNQALRRALNMPLSLFTLNHDDTVSAVSFSDDGQRVATASWDHTARVWDAQTGEPLFTLNHNDSVLAVSFSDDGQRVATASRDKTARVWDAQTGEPLFTLNHDDWVLAVSFSDDGQRVATASRDKTLRVHWLWSRDLAEQVCLRLIRNLTAAEWTNYVQTDLTNYSLTCPQLPVHSTVIEAAKQSAETGKVQEATALFRRILKLARDAGQTVDIDPSTKSFEQDPKAVALKFSAVSVVREAENLAREGKLRQAISRYQKALSLNSETDLNPATKEVIEDDPEAVANAIHDAATQPTESGQSD